jgi:hypothetical protein
MDALIETPFARFDTEAVEQVLLLSRVEQRQLAQTLLRIGDQRFQQIAPMPAMRAMVGSSNRSVL